jgi:TetR/AcrR family transcriptional repressor of nem operon
MSNNREILEQAALNTVQRGGLKGLSFRTLADEVGIKSSSVHYYFPEKSDLAEALIKRYSEAFMDQLHDIGGKSWNLNRKLKAFIAIFENVASENKFCLCGMMAAEIEQLNESNRRQLADYFTRTEDWLVAQFDQHKSELSAHSSHLVLAKSLLSGLEGALLVDRVVGDKQRLKAQKDLFLKLIG